MRAVHYAASLSIYMRNDDRVGYSMHPVCGAIGDTIATDRSAKVTCKRCRKWFTRKKGRGVEEHLVVGEETVS